MTPGLGDPLSSEDAAILYAEVPGTQQIGALCFFEGSPLRDARGRLRHEELMSYVEARLNSLPRFRQRIAAVPGDLATPMWVDDSGFDIARHCKLVELPEDGGSTDLRQLMGRLLSTPMDLAHPLWDIHLVDGLEPGSAPGVDDRDVVAVVVRAHHVMADGIALHAAATLLLEAAARPFEERADSWSPRPEPGPIDLTVSALIERTRRQARVVLDATTALVDPRRLIASVRSALRLAGMLRNGVPATAPALAITAPTGRRRAFAWSSIPMADIVAAKTACGATVNDVVLAVVAGALRRQLGEAGVIDRLEKEPRALVPIGSAGPTAEGMHNRFSMTTVGLPVFVDDPTERVRVIHSRMHGSSPTTTQSLMPRVFSVVDFVPPPLLRSTAPRLLARQPLVNLAVSNIPGSRAPLYLWESRMLSLHPFINVVGNLALIIGVLSYVDDLGVGISVDPDVVGDPDALVPHLRAAVAELMSCV
jgi:WS/DGAT/MGAT family acyltransferase